MGIFDRLLRKNNPDDIFNRMPTDPNDFMVALSQRGNWRKIDMAIFTDISRNADEEATRHLAEDAELCELHGIEKFSKKEVKLALLRNFAFVSEQAKVVETYIEQSTFTDIKIATPLTLFSHTLRTIGFQFLRFIIDDCAPDQVVSESETPHLAFTSSILCDPLQLASYFGLVLLYGDVVINQVLGLYWCQRYLDAEKRLLKSPPKELCVYHQASKEFIEGDTSMIDETILEYFPKDYPQLLYRDINDSNSISDIVREVKEVLMKQD